MNNAQRMLVWGLGWLAATLARGDVHVAPNGPGPAPFSSWATAAPDIQTAVTAAPPGGTVLISNGVYALAATIIVDRNLTLRGMPAAAPPTIDGGSAVRCLAAAAGTTVQLESLRFVNGTGGATGLHGGGACIVNGAVRDCVFSNNAVTVSGVYGGGLYLSGSGVVERTLFVHNAAQYGGGGLSSYQNPYLRVQGCDFLENAAGGAGGGGLRMQSAAGVTVNDCRFIGNTTTNLGSGAGLNANGAPVSAAPNLITNCLIAGNTAGVVGGGVGYGGGGIALLAGGDSYTVADSIITNNAAANQGGGISMSKGRVHDSLIAFNRQWPGDTLATYGGAGVYMSGGELINCRIEGNVASYAGGGVFPSSGLIRNCLIINNMRTNGAGSYGGGGIRIRDDYGLRIESCTIAGNFADMPGGGINTWAPTVVVNTIIDDNTCSYSADYRNLYLRNAGTNTWFTNSCFKVFSKGNQSRWVDCLHVDPRLEGPDYTLAAPSPCIDRGFWMPWMEGARDLAGRARVDRASGLVDMGCFEYIPPGTVLLLQ